MRNRKILITDKEWFESGSLKNPITSFDHELEKYFPAFYSLNYDTKLLATDPSTKKEKEFFAYNDYRERYGTCDLSALDSEIQKTGAKNILLSGVTQDLFEYIAPLIKDTAEVLYFFKCSKIANLSELSHFKNLKCVHIFYNNSLTELWDMKDNKNLKVISFQNVFKLSNIEELQYAFAEYVHIDSMDNYGRTKPALFEVPDFEQMPHLRYVSLDFKDCKKKKSQS